LTDGQTLCITSGTLTGSIQYSGNASICVAANATLQPTAFTRSGSTSTIIINNYGSFIGPAVSHTFAGGTINNYHFMQFKGSVTISGSTKFINHPNSFASFDLNLTTSSSNSAVITNQGTLDVNGTFNLQTGNTLTNFGRLHTFNSLTLRGTFTNNAIVVARGTTGIFSGKTTNNCRFTATSNFNSYATDALENNGFLWVSGAASSFGSPSFINRGYVRAANYSTTGTVDNIGGQIVVEGESTHSGSINGGRVGDLGNAPTYRFDIHSANITSEVGAIALQDTTTMSPSSCNFIALPVKVLGFSAALADARNVQLKWTVAEETNVYAYLVERLTETNSRWEVIGTVWPDGTRALNNYRYGDRIASQEKIQYRLKIVDLNGSVAYSSIQIIQPRNISTAPALYPNPVSDILTISSLTTDAEIALYDLNGNRILPSFAVSNNTTQLNTAFLSGGIYVIKIKQKGTVTYHKLVKR
jgi:hypothetical protein